MSKDRINTGELASLLATQVAGTPREAEDFLKALILVMEEQLLANDVLKIKGLGTFKLQWNEPRKSVDVNTAEEIMIDGYYKISYTPEPELKELVNAPFAHLQPVIVGGPEEEEMEEEEVEAVEEEVMKEMEDPKKLEDAMKSIAEQAIEIKDILAEMNMMGGVKRQHRPVMVEEDIPADTPAAVTSDGNEPAAKQKAENVAGTSGVEEKSTPVKSTRRGPVVPYGPPPKPENEEDEVEIAEETEVNNPHEHQEVNPTSSSQPSQLEKTETLETEQENTGQKIPEQPTVLESTPAHSHNIVVEDAPVKKIVKPQKYYGLLLLIVGIIAGGVITYLLNSMNLLPDVTSLFSKNEKTAIIPISDSSDYYVVENGTKDSLYTDSVVKSGVEKQEKVDSLQLLFDTPREYTVFIATEEVREGSRMTRISERHYGAKEFWVYIYEANRNLLHHPDDIAKGMKLKIPHVDPRLIDKNNPRSIEYALHLHDQYVKK